MEDINHVTRFVYHYVVRSGVWLCCKYGQGGYLMKKNGSLWCFIGGIGFYILAPCLESFSNWIQSKFNKSILLMNHELESIGVDGQEENHRVIGFQANNMETEEDEYEEDC